MIGNSQLGRTCSLYKVIDSKQIGRRILFLRNGNLQFPGNRLLISERKYPTFDHLLDDVNKLKVSEIMDGKALYQLGTKYIYNTSGEQVTFLNQLKNGCKYVCCASLFFEALDYEDKNKAKKPHLDKITMDLMQIFTQVLNCNALGDQINNTLLPKLIVVILAGESPRNIASLMLDKKQDLTLKAVYNAIQTTLNIMTQKIRQINTLDKVKIENVSQFFEESNIVFIVFTKSIKSKTDFLLSSNELEFINSSMWSYAIDVKEDVLKKSLAHDNSDNSDTFQFAKKKSIKNSSSSPRITYKIPVNDKEIENFYENNAEMKQSNVDLTNNKEINLDSSNMIQNVEQENEHNMKRDDLIINNLNTEDIYRLLNKDKQIANIYNNEQVNIHNIKQDFINPKINQNDEQSNKYSCLINKDLPNIPLNKRSQLLIDCENEDGENSLQNKNVDIVNSNKQLNLLQYYKDELNIENKINKTDEVRDKKIRLQNIYSDNPTYNKKINVLQYFEDNLNFETKSQNVGKNGKSFTPSPNFNSYLLRSNVNVIEKEDTQKTTSYEIEDNYKEEEEADKKITLFLAKDQIMKKNDQFFMKNIFGKQFILDNLKEKETPGSPFSDDTQTCDLINFSEKKNNFDGFKFNVRKTKCNWTHNKDTGNNNYLTYNQSEQLLMLKELDELKKYEQMEKFGHFEKCNIENKVDQDILNKNWETPAFYCQPDAIHKINETLNFQINVQNTETRCNTREMKAFNNNTIPNSPDTLDYFDANSIHSLIEKEMSEGQNNKYQFLNQPSLLNDSNQIIKQHREKAKLEDNCFVNLHKYSNQPNFSTNLLNNKHSNNTCQQIKIDLLQDNNYTDSNKVNINLNEENNYKSSFENNLIILQDNELVVNENTEKKYNYTSKVKFDNKLVSNQLIKSDNSIKEQNSKKYINTSNSITQLYKQDALNGSKLNQVGSNIIHFTDNNDDSSIILDTEEEIDRWNNIKPSYGVNDEIIRKSKYLEKDKSNVNTKCFNYINNTNNQIEDINVNRILPLININQCSNILKTSNFTENNEVFQKINVDKNDYINNKEMPNYNFLLEKQQGIKPLTNVRGENKNEISLINDKIFNFNKSKDQEKVISNKENNHTYSFIELNNLADMNSIEAQTSSHLVCHAKLDQF